MIAVSLGAIVGLLVGIFSLIVGFGSLVIKAIGRIEKLLVEHLSGG